MQRRHRIFRPRHALAAAIALLPGTHAWASDTGLDWELAVVARAPQSRLTAPSLGIAPGSGALQVAYGLMGDQVSSQGGIYLQEIGGRLRRIAGDLDPTPGQPGQQLCLSAVRCGGPGNLRVTLDNGAVAFIAQSQIPTQTEFLPGVSGVYLADAAGLVRRIADTSQVMPGDAAQRRFSSFSTLGLALDRGRVAFNGWSGGTGNVLDALHAGIYVGDGAGLGLVANDNTVLPGGSALGGPTAFGGNVALRTTTSGDTVVAFDASLKFLATGIGNIRSVMTWSVRDGFAYVARSGVDFPFNQTSLFLGSMDATGTTAMRADVSGGGNVPAGIWLGPPLRAVATAQTPTGGTPLGNFGFDPAVDVAPRGVGQTPTTRWVAFVAGLDVWLRREDLGTGAVTLERIADRQRLATLASNALRCPVPADDIVLENVDLQGEATKDGAVAFRFSAWGGNAQLRCDASDLIVLARRTAPTLMLRADADTQVRADLAVRRNDNYGLQDTLLVGTGREPVGAADRMRSLLHFDLSALPRLALTDARLRTTVHGYDNGSAATIHSIDLHLPATAWHTNGGEGNGYEGSRPPGAAATLTGTDPASGVAWAGAADNPDPAAANNTSQPALDFFASASQTVRQASATPGTRIEWSLGAVAQGWLDGAPNTGVALTDSTSDGSFRGVRFGSREGEVYRLPGWVEGPRLALRWSVGIRAGDLTGDGCIDRDDLKLLTAIVTGKATAGPDLAARLDLNADGRTDLADARKLTTLFSHPGGAACPAQPSLRSPS